MDTEKKGREMERSVVPSARQRHEALAGVIRLVQALLKLRWGAAGKRRRDPLVVGLRFAT